MKITLENTSHLTSEEAEMEKATARAFAADKIHRAACADGLTYGDPFFDAAQQELDAAGIAYDAARAKTWAKKEALAE